MTVHIFHVKAKTAEDAVNAWMASLEKPQLIPGGSNKKPTSAKANLSKVQLINVAYDKETKLWTIEGRDDL